MSTQRRSAFTLVELLIVVAVLGLLMTLATLAWKEAKVRAYDTQALVCARNIKTAEAMYLTDNRRYTTYENLSGQDLSGCLVVYRGAALSGGQIFAELPGSVLPALRQTADMLQSTVMAAAQTVTPPAAAPPTGPVGNGNAQGFAYRVKHASGRTTFVASEDFLGPLTNAPASAVALSNTGTGAPVAAAAAAAAAVTPTSFPSYTAANRTQIQVSIYRYLPEIFYGIPTSYVITDPDGNKIDVTPGAPSVASLNLTSGSSSIGSYSTTVATYSNLKPGTYTMTVSSTGNCVTSSYTALCPRVLNDYRTVSRSYSVSGPFKTAISGGAHRFSNYVNVSWQINASSAYRNFIIEGVRVFNPTDLHDDACAGDCAVTQPTRWVSSTYCSVRSDIGNTNYGCSIDDLPGSVYLRFRPLDTTRPMDLTGLSGWSATGIIPVGAPNVTGPHVTADIAISPTILVKMVRDSAPKLITTTRTTQTPGDASGYTLPRNMPYVY